jgi:F-type H+-transporting ATPase subunit b
MTFPRTIRPLLIAFVAVILVGAAPARAQEHTPPAPQQSPVPQGAQPVHPEGAPAAQHAEDDHAEGNPIVTIVARLLNFGILVGLLVYFLRSPFAAYLASRSTQIRQDLVTAADMRAAATARLADIEAKMRALPAELEALTRQGVEDVKAEQVRIAQAAAAERRRLLDQTGREIDMRLRVARRELTEHAAHLAVGVAEQRIRRAITPEDQVRLVDRYASQLSAAREVR